MQICTLDTDLHITIVYCIALLKTFYQGIAVTIIRCDNIDPVYWAYVTEYARKKRIERCEALQDIIMEHALFAKKAHEQQFGRLENVSKKKASKK